MWLFKWFLFCAFLNFEIHFLYIFFTLLSCNTFNLSHDYSHWLKHHLLCKIFQINNMHWRMTNPPTGLYIALGLLSSHKRREVREAIKHVLKCNIKHKIAILLWQRKHKAFTFFFIFISTPHAMGQSMTRNFIVTIESFEHGSPRNQTNLYLPTHFCCLIV